METGLITGEYGMMQQNIQTLNALCQKQAVGIEQLQATIAELTANYAELSGMYQALEDRAVGYETERDDLAAKLAAHQLLLLNLNRWFGENPAWPIVRHKPAWYEEMLFLLGQSAASGQR